ncbi:hypothetical protein KIW84_032012 [Lathyrus oleraceus]|uniref:Uncharacterized protein n=1 Tax=Pisum sativum TaxID=3888 RepID=A0A9D5AW27_PEA|nr:hypothetical protein KIW84_032012 [Pisum sativum]
MLKPRHGSLPKALGIPSLAMNLTSKVAVHCQGTPHYKEKINDYSPNTHVYSNNYKPNNVQHTTLTPKTPINPIIHTLEHGFPFNTPSLPIFTPAASLDFKSANEDDSDYDPFAAIQSEDDRSGSKDANGVSHIPMPQPSKDYYDIDDPFIECQYCRALLWNQERMGKHKHSSNPKFSLSWGNGKIEITFLKEPPDILASLLFDHDSIHSRKFQ